MKHHFWRWFVATLAVLGFVWVVGTAILYAARAI